MEERLLSKYYKTIDMFARDMQLVVDNCRSYNSPETNYVKCANTLEEFFKKQIQKTSGGDEDGH